MKRLLVISTATSLVLTACAAPSQPILDALTQQCQAGDQSACNAMPLAQADVIREHNEQSERIAHGVLAVLGVALLGAAAVAAARSAPPPPVSIVPPPPPPPFGLPR
jgi:hypothetical protein